MRAAIYARVSTGDQHLDVQLHALREHAAARGWTIAGEFSDVLSGQKDRRPGLDALLKAARAGQVDVVAVVRLDRLARSVRNLVNVGHELEALKVDLVATEQAIDTTTPAGRFLFVTLGAVAALEADLIRERTLAGLARARRLGKRLGRPESTNASSRARIRRLAAAGQTVSYIARTVGVSRPTVRRALKGPSS